LKDDLLKLRIELLLKFTKKFIKGAKNIDYAGKIEEDSLAEKFLNCKNFALASAKEKIL